MKNKEVIDNCLKKMYFNLTKEEEQVIDEAITSFDENFKDINQKFPELESTEPMFYTITIEDLKLREDIPVQSTEITELLSNTTNVVDREVEVPKVVQND